MAQPIDQNSKVDREGIKVPYFKTTHQMVNLKAEIETKLRRMAPDLENRFIYRQVAFAISGTSLVDLKCDLEDPNCSREAKLACRIQVKQLTELMTQTVLSRRKIQRFDQYQTNDLKSLGPAKNKVSLSDSFQEIFFLNLLGIKICIVHNDVLCVATLAKNDPKLEDTQALATRYFSAQFWCEFTKEVLTEFLHEDILLQDKIAEKEQAVKRNQQGRESAQVPRKQGVLLTENNAADLELTLQDADPKKGMKQHNNIHQSVKISPRGGTHIGFDTSQVQLSERPQNECGVLESQPVEYIDVLDRASQKLAENDEWLQTEIQPHESSQKSMQFQSDDLRRRNFYLTLFRLYSAIPFKDCISSFTKIFNDVFIHERPSCVHKYSLTEVMVTEMLEADEDAPAMLNRTHSVPFHFNFMAGSTRQCNYQAMPSFHTFLNKAIRQIKRSDLALGTRIDLHKRGRKAQGNQQDGQMRDQERSLEPQNGHEFFFSNVMLKIYQVPMLFHRSSEEADHQEEEGSFMVLIFEKQTRKRTYAKTTTQQQRINRASEAKRMGEKRYVEELMIYRDSKMRRFCNYFVTLFNQKKINPFTQFIAQAKLKAVKATVRENMDKFTSGELRPQDDPPMAEPEKSTAEEAPPSEAAAEPYKAKSGKKEEGKAQSDDGGQTKGGEVDQFKDKSGLHYKPGMRATSKTPAPNPSSFRQVASIGDLISKKQVNEQSRVSLNFGGGGSRSNLSSIVHMEEVSAGYYSIDRQEYRVQKKLGAARESKILTQRSSANALKEEPFEQAKPDQIQNILAREDSAQEFDNLQGQLRNMNENPYDDQNKKSANQASPANRLKEGDLMRKSAQNLPSLGSIRVDGRRDSYISGANRSMKGNDSIMSLFQHIPEKLGNAFQQQMKSGKPDGAGMLGSRHSQSSLSGFSRDFADLIQYNRASMNQSEEDKSFNGDQQIGVAKSIPLVKSKLQKRDSESVFKGNALGFGANFAPGASPQIASRQSESQTLVRVFTGGALENIKEEVYLSKGGGPINQNQHVQDHGQLISNSVISPTSSHYQTAANAAMLAKSSGKSSAQPSSSQHRTKIANQAVASAGQESYASEYDDEEEEEYESESRSQSHN